MEREIKVELIKSKKKERKGFACGSSCDLVLSLQSIEVAR